MSTALGTVETTESRVVRALNGPYHLAASITFAIIVLGHWSEHIVQAIQIYAWHWPRPEALGVLGLVWPWLIKSEWLHYWYAVVMLVGFIILRPAFQGMARAWWDVALWIQVWHHFEHALLLGQALTGRNLFGASVPTSIIQLLVPRVELHLFYNAVVTIPMAIAVAYHLFGSLPEGVRPTCACSRWAAQWAPLGHAHS
jgi:hypothetical protein